MNYKDLNIAVEAPTETITFNGYEVHVKGWLSTTERLEFIQFVVRNSMEPTKGTFSPVVVEAFKNIAYVKFFTDIELDEDDLSNPGKLNDELVYSGLIERIKYVHVNNTNKMLDCLELLLTDTILDIEKFNSSFAGTLIAMKDDSAEVSQQLAQVIEQIKNREGIEELVSIKETLDKAD